MKILISNIGVFQSPKASFLRSYYFARELVKLGHEVTFITQNNEKYYFPYKIKFEDGVKYIIVSSILPKKISKFGYGFLSLLVRLFYVTLNNNFDIVHADNHRPASSFPCLWHRFFFGSVFVAEWWDLLGKTGQYDTKSKYFKYTIGCIDNYLENKIYHVADGVIVLSKFLKERVVSLGQSKSRVELIWGGSDINKIGFFESSITYRNKYNIPNDDVVLMTTGLGKLEIQEYKQLFIIFNNIFKRNSNFILTKTGPKIPDKVKEEYKIGPYLKELGFVDYYDYQYALSCADLFIAIQGDNNKNKGRWPNSVGDYLAVGRPILHNNIGDLNDFSTQFPDGSITVDMNDKDIETQIEKIICNIDKYRDRYKIIRNFAENNFSWHNRAKQLEKFYNRSIKNNE